MSVTPLDALHPEIFDCSGRPFHLSATLASGQNFRWRRDTTGVWWGVIDRTVVAAWQEEGQPDSPLYWRTFPESGGREILTDYFRLDVDLETLYVEWTRAEPRIAEAVAAFRGLRLLRQPPVECFFAFQCATCNTVVKIERSVYRLAQRYGTPLPVPERPSELPGFYAFPTIAALAEADEATLRSDLWGFRAPRVIALARHLNALPPAWLESLRQAPYAEAHAALTALHGIGAKVADCICLFALDQDAAAPVDTHVRKIATRLFLPALSGKSLTPAIYTALADAYRTRFGAYAGWAQQYLFFAEMRRSEDFAC